MNNLNGYCTFCLITVEKNKYCSSQIEMENCKIFHALKDPSISGLKNTGYSSLLENDKKLLKEYLKELNQANSNQDNYVSDNPLIGNEKAIKKFIKPLKNLKDEIDSSL